MSSVRPSVTLMDQQHVGWKSWKLIARTITPTFALRSPKAIHLLSGNMGKFGESIGGVGISGVLDYKSGNISETRKDRGKVTMESL